MKVELDDIQVMNLKPDDVIVYKIDLMLPLEKLEAIVRNLKHTFPNNKIVTLDKNSNIELYRPASIENDQDNS